MSTDLDVDTLVGVLGREAERLLAEYDRVLPGDPVPTCPRWSVADLVGHLGGVHRWAAATVRGARADGPPDGEIASLMRVPDAATGSGEAATGALRDWFAAGAADLRAALRSASDDLRAPRFLRDAPAPRLFWARRQVHETTIHRVDALAARVGRLPTPAEAEIETWLAVDGIDELVRGFVPRGSTKLRTTEPFRIAIEPTDADAGWTVAVSPDPPVTTVGADPGADAQLRGTAAALYLGLWNRGDDIAETGAVDALGHWREQVRVQWR